MANLAAARRVARRAWPVALALYRRWEQLPPQEKERYRKMARENAVRSRQAAARSAGTVSEAWRRRRRR